MGVVLKWDTLVKWLYDWPVECTRKAQHNQGARCISSEKNRFPLAYRILSIHITPPHDRRPLETHWRPFERLSRLGRLGRLGRLVLLVRCQHFLLLNRHPVPRFYLLTPCRLYLIRHPRHPRHLSLNPHDHLQPYRRRPSHYPSTPLHPPCSRPHPLRLPRPIPSPHPPAQYVAIVDNGSPDTRAITAPPSIFGVPSASGRRVRWCRW